MRSVLAAVAVLTALVAPAAHAAPVSSLSVYSDGRDFIGQGVPRVAHPGGPVVSAGPDPFGDGGLAVGAVTGPEGVGVEIAPPPGEGLRPHNRTRTDRYPFQTSGRPGLTVRAGNRGCNVAGGSVEVLDVGFDAQGPSNGYGRSSTTTARAPARRRSARSVGAHGCRRRQRT